jgi:predicted acyl esterase
MKGHLLVAAVVAAGLIAPNASAIDETKPATSCYGLAFSDPAGDQVPGGAGAQPSARENLDLLGAFFKFDAAEGAEAATVNVRVKNLSKEIPPGRTSVVWAVRLRTPESGGTTVWATVNLAGSVTYHYGHSELLVEGTYRAVRDGATTGAFFEGADGIVQIVLPAEAQIAGEVIGPPVVNAVEAVEPVPSLPFRGGQWYVSDRDEGDDPWKVGAPCPAAPATKPLPVNVLTKSGRVEKERLAVKLRSSEAITKLDARLLKGTRSVARGSLAKLDGSGTLTLKISKKLKIGTYVLELAGSDASGARRLTKVKITLRGPAKSTTPKKCRTLKGAGRAKCVARARKCSNAYVKKYNRTRTKATCARKPKPLAPTDYTRIAGLSQPRFGKDSIERIPLEVPSHDGVNMYVEIIKPKAEGRYPVVMEASGYHGTLYNRDGTRILPDPKGPDGRPLGLVGYFVPRGYAVLMMDVRGTGRSEGCLDHLGKNDLKDIKAVIDWAETQPWSNGRIGMTGHSYVGGTANVGVAGGARGLKTIVPSASLASMYDHQFQGGVPYNLQYVGPIFAYEQLALQADLPQELSPLTAAAGEGATGDNFGNDPEYTGCGASNSAALAGTGQVTGQYEAFHAARDHRAAVKNANIPIFLQHGTLDHAARIAGVQWMFERNLRSGDKLWIGQWAHGISSAPTSRGLQWTNALHAWFDKHLMQRDVDTGPPLEVFLSDQSSDGEPVAQGQILAGREMPKTKPFTLYARGEEGLADLPGEPGTVSFAGDANGYLEDNEAAGGVTFMTRELTEDKLFFGIPSLKLKAAVTNGQTHLIATLFAVDESPAVRRRLTQCAMNPILKDGVDKIAPIVPGTTYALTPPCFAISFQARKGQKLRLRITTSDDDKVPVHSHDPRVTVGVGGAEGTAITLPEVVGGALFKDSIDLGDTSGDPNAGA